MGEMTSRERFWKVINHQEPDRVPIDVGQDMHNGIHEIAYKNLLNYLGEEDEIKLYDQMQHLATCKESILNLLHADTRYIFANPAEGFELKIDEDKSWLDEWGVRRKNFGLYDDNVARPLEGCTLQEVKKYKVPDPVDPGRFKGLREKAESLYNNTEYAIVGASAASLFFLSSELMGFQEYMEKIVLEPLLVETLVDKVLEWEIAFFDKYLDAIGDYTQMFWMGDDWGTQLGPIMNPRTFKEIFVKRYKIFTDFVKKKANVKIALHCCGSITWAMDDFFEAGIDVIHPLQPTAYDMGNPKKLKESFGKKLVFYSNLLNQTIIPYGTPEEVKAEVIEKIKWLAPGGGYIISGGHNIQADVPPANIIALFDTAYKYGRYRAK